MIEDRGSATVAMLGMMATVIICSVAVAALGALYAAKAQAENAADAAALAAAVATYPGASSDSPVPSARDIAARNGARLVTCQCIVDGRLAPRTVQVAVAVEANVPIFGAVEVRSSARAEFDPGRWLGP